MSDITIKTIEEIEPYSGPHAIDGIRFRGVRGALGISAWGMNVLELDPNCSDYPEHDHVADGQEETYFVVAGEVIVQADGAEHRVGEGAFVRVPPEVRRKLVTGERGATVLAIGATPGKPYEPGASM